MFKLNELQAWVRANVLNQPTWSPDSISDEWFRVHFDYAGDVLNSWLKGVVNLPQARILNFGCGDGIADLALVLKHGAKNIHGVDIRHEYRKLPKIAREQLGLYKLPSALSFQTIEPGAKLQNGVRVFDAIISWSTFEHVDRAQLKPILSDLHACLKPGGVFFMQIEPLYFSPYGSHLRRYIDEPWKHLLIDEHELWCEIANHAGSLDDAEVDFGFDDFGPEGYKKFVFNEYKHLNKVTADELLEMLVETGFKPIRQERRSLDMPVPEKLLERYTPDCLLNNELIVLLTRD